MFQALFIKLLNLIHDIKGTTAIEYAIIATGISLAIAVFVYAFGDELQALYEDNLSDALNE